MMKTASVRLFMVATGALALLSWCILGQAQQTGPAAVAQATTAASAPANAVANWPAGKVVGWRGDGSGHYPDATPPTTWSKSETGVKKNIVWETKLPCFSWSTPVIVGDKVFTMSEPYDLICLNKQDGKLLWIQSFPPFVGMTDEKSKAKPLYKEVEGLVKQLQELNNQFVANGWSKELYAKKYAIQKQINAKTAELDEDYTLPKDMYVESWAGYTGGTPCSDGQSVFFYAWDGITARYDLDGNRKWAQFHSNAGKGGEHGDAFAPTVVGDLLLVPGKALKKETGETAWTHTLKGTGNGCFSITPFKRGGVDYAVSYANLFRVSDGKIYGEISSFTATTPQILDDMIYYCGIGGHISYNKIDSQPNGDLKVTNVTPINKAGYSRLEPPAEIPAKKDDASNWYSSSPIFHDGLMYVITVQGWFSVADVKANQILYQKKLPLDFKNPWHRKSWGMGMGASMCLAGKYLYLMDSSGCTLVLEPGREYKQVAKNNIDYIVPDGWEPFHWTGAHHEQTEASMAFEGSRIYIRGEQFLYCVGEK